MRIQRPAIPSSLATCHPSPARASALLICIRTRARSRLGAWHLSWCLSRRCSRCRSGLLSGVLNWPGALRLALCVKEIQRPAIPISLAARRPCPARAPALLVRTCACAGSRLRAWHLSWWWGRCRGRRLRWLWGGLGRCFASRRGSRRWQWPSAKNIRNYIHVYARQKDLVRVLADPQPPQRRGSDWHIGRGFTVWGKYSPLLQCSSHAAEGPPQ
mmetsp:Transcript_53654/g.135526  ORF Transcript_53654/g.135526 Transcript_53654/m.135526 type:complete len:215 (-) Transcript_53654:2-646(-)